MNKNNIFETIENNIISNNIINDSKKLFEDFLGLFQGNKLKEANDDSENNLLQYSKPSL